MVHVLEMGVHHTEEVLFWHMPLQMDWEASVDGLP